MSDEDYTLPCDVRLPPNTIIGAGCTLATLKRAMELAGRPRNFPDRPKPPRSAQ